MLNAFDDLEIIESICIENESRKYTDEYIFFCPELINENNKYIPLENILESNINKIQFSLSKLLKLENKAIVCRGMRHLLPIVMYGIFINSTTNESTGIGNSVIDMFDELFDKKPNDKNSSIGKKLQQINASATKNSETNEKLGKWPEQRKEELEGISSSLMEKIKTTIQLILPFTETLINFHNLYYIKHTMMDSNKSDRNSLLSILDELKNMYRTECYPDVDATALLHNGDREGFERKYNSIPLLVGEIDRLFVTIRNDLELLFVKFFPANNYNKMSESNVTMTYNHTFNKYHNPEVWRLIGNETVVDNNSDESAEPAPTLIDKVASNIANNIQGTTDRLMALIENSIRCRCYAYLKFITKLHYCTVRVLVANVGEVQRLVRELQGIEGIEQDKAYTLFHEKLNGLGTTECVVSDEVGAIDKLLNGDGVDKYFRIAYAVYWNRNVESVSNAIDNVIYYLSDASVAVEFGPMLREIHQIQIQSDPEIKSVESLVKWYKWGEQVYKDRCLPGEHVNNNLSALNDNMQQVLEVTTDNPTTRLTLEWIMKMTVTLNRDLENDLYPIDEQF